MPGKIGLLLILGIFGSAIFATGLMVWVFFRATSEPTKPAPKTGVVYQLETRQPDYIFVDGRIAGANSWSVSASSL